MSSKEYKEKFLEAFRKSRDEGNDNLVYTIEMLYALKEMADHDVFPDGRFGDSDCEVWSMFRR